MQTMNDIITEVYGGLDNMTIIDKDEINDTVDTVPEVSDVIDEDQYYYDLACRIADYYVNAHTEVLYDLPADKPKLIRRKNNIYKAKRKQKIAAKIYSGYPYYNNLHQYSKNKIHCSCPWCAFNHKKKGYVNRPISDLRNIEKLNFQLIDEAV